MVHKNNFRRRQRRSESRLDETVRVASIVQKGIASGRSSYVEMRALERIVRHNLVLKVQLVKESGAFTKDGDFSELLARASQAHTGYSDTITPNGVLSILDTTSCSSPWRRALEGSSSPPRSVLRIPTFAA